MGEPNGTAASRADCRAAARRLRAPKSRCSKPANHNDIVCRDPEIDVRIRAARDNCRVPINDEVIPAEKTGRAHCDAEQRRQRRALAQPSPPNRLAFCPGARVDRVDHPQRSTPAPPEAVGGLVPGPSRGWVKPQTDQRPEPGGNDKNGGDDADHRVIPRQGEQIKGNILAEDRVTGPGSVRSQKAQQRDPKGRRGETDQCCKNKGRKPWGARRHRPQWPAQCPQVEPQEYTYRNQYSEKDPQPEPECQPIAVALAELPEPVLLERDV